MTSAGLATSQVIGKTCFNSAQWRSGSRKADASQVAKKSPLAFFPPLLCFCEADTNFYRAADCRTRRRSRSRSLMKKEGRCFKCGGRGHLQRDCKGRRSDSRSRRKRSRSSSRSYSSDSDRSRRRSRRH